MADDAGIDFMLPIGRWKGYGGASDFHGTTFETMTWACGLLAATKRITVFGTVHAPLFHPLIAAKEMVTADHIGEGRFGLNIVAGWNEGEFEMFGIDQRGHERPLRIRPGMDRRGQARLVGARTTSILPAILQPRRRALPAGTVWRHAAGDHERRPSATGQAFAMRNCDAFFTSTAALRLAVAGTRAETKTVSVFDRIVEQVQRIKAEARAFGRDIEVYHPRAR